MTQQITRPAPLPRTRARARARARGLALSLLLTVQLMLILDMTLVNVAPPRIQVDLGFTPSNLSWVLNAYTLSFGGLLLLGGRLGDVLGRRRTFTAGLAVFSFASLLGGLAHSPTCSSPHARSGGRRGPGRTERARTDHDQRLG